MYKRQVYNPQPLPGAVRMWVYHVFAGGGKFVCNYPVSYTHLGPAACMPGYPIVEDKNGDGIIDVNDSYMDNTCLLYTSRTIGWIFVLRMQKLSFLL